MTDRPKIIPFLGWEELDRRFEPYAVQLGWIAYSWNALHDALGLLFAVLVNPKNASLPLVIWNAIPNDRTQRGVLKAVGEKVLASKEAELDAVRWLLSMADKFEDRRNDALHTPFSFEINEDGTNLVAKSFSGHKRAMKLKDKDLLAEFEWYGRSVHMLAQYAITLRLALGDSHNFAWPEKPVMPPLKKSG